MHTMVKNNYLLGCYEKAMPNTLTIKEKLQAVKAAGFDYLEISIDETDEKLARLDYHQSELDHIKSAMMEVNIPILTMCLSGHRKYPLGSHDPVIQQTALTIFYKACQLANSLGIRIIQLAGYDVYYEEHDEMTATMFEDNLKKCVDMASQYGILLGFETMETPFMDTIKKAMQYVNDINSPYLNVYPDIGNLTNASRKYHTLISEDIYSGRGKIIAAHLKEVIEGHYREIPFGSGDTLYDSALLTLHQLGVRIFTGEFWYVGSFDWSGDLLTANHYLRAKIDQYYNSTNNTK
jgi:L-ribulose-5-phosphate 3-epimerase